MTLKKKHVILLGLLSCLFVMVAVLAQEARSVNNQIFINATGSIGFQNDTNSTVQVTVLTGFLNSSVNQIRVYDGGGYFKWTNLNTTGFRVTYSDVHGVKVAGDQDNDMRVIASGSTFTAVTGDRVEVIWSYGGIAPLLPVLFILGLVGVTATIGGPTYAIYLMKRREYRKGLIQGVIYTSIGIGLVLGWLWGVG